MHSYVQNPIPSGNMERKRPLTSSSSSTSETASKMMKFDLDDFVSHVKKGLVPFLTDFNETQEEVKKVSRVREETERENRSLKSAISAGQEKLEDLNRQLGVAQTTLKSERAGYAIMVESSKQKENELVELRSQLAKADADLKHHKEMLDMEKMAHQSFQTAYDELDKTRKLHYKMQEKKDQRISVLENEIAELRGQALASYQPKTSHPDV